MERKSSCQMLIQAVRAGRRNVFTRRLPPPFYHVISCLRTFMSPRSLIAAAAAVVVSLRHDSDGSNSDCGNGDEKRVDCCVVLARSRRFSRFAGSLRSFSCCFRFHFSPLLLLLACVWGALQVASLVE